MSVTPVVRSSEDRPGKEAEASGVEERQVKKRGLQTFWNSNQAKLIEVSGRFVHHARRYVFQLVELMATRDMFHKMLEPIWRIRPRPTRGRWRRDATLWL